MNAVKYIPFSGGKDTAEKVSISGGATQGLYSCGPFTMARTLKIFFFTTKFLLDIA